MTGERPFIFTRLGIPQLHPLIGSIHTRNSKYLPIGVEGYPCRPIRMPDERTLTFPHLGIPHL